MIIFFLEPRTYFLYRFVLGHLHLDQNNFPDIRFEEEDLILAFLPILKSSSEAFMNTTFVRPALTRFEMFSVEMLANYGISRRQQTRW